MVGRCTLPKHSQFNNYGGKGIKVCKRWLTFANFLADMGVRPVGTSLDRFPNASGNYRPGNTRWATPHEQAINRSTTKISAADVVKIFGMRRRGMLQREIAAKFGISSAYVCGLLKGVRWSGTAKAAGFKVPAPPPDKAVAVQARRMSVTNAMRKAFGNPAGAAKILGMSRSGVCYQLKVLGLAGMLRDGRKGAARRERHR
jgi:hypothetical protein